MGELHLGFSLVTGKPIIYKGDTGCIKRLVVPRDYLVRTVYRFNEISSPFPHVVPPTAELTMQRDMCAPETLALALHLTPNYFCFPGPDTLDYRIKSFRGCIFTHPCAMTPIR